MSQEDHDKPAPEEVSERYRLRVASRAFLIGLGRSLRFGRRWAVRAFAFILLFTAFLFPTGDRFILTPTEQAAQTHLFSILDWEITNFLDKWTNRFTTFFSGGTSEEEARAALDRYLSLAKEIERLKAKQSRAVADPDTGEDTRRELEEQLSALVAERGDLRDEVEEYLEGMVSTTLRGQGLELFGELVWPPVDIRLESPPRILITSPRDDILRLESVLLNPDVSTPDAERLENRVQGELDLSAVVLGLGGLATYPTFVRDDRSLFDILEKTAHEWLHAYLFFHPLGFNYNANSRMQTLNETVANVAGEELGAMAFRTLTGQEPPDMPGDASEGPEGRNGDQEAFSFDDFMHETRVRTDELLAAGEIEEAEAFMESRRRELIHHGFFIRKLNQAWFAFHGTYADTGASVSPIGPEVHELRSLTPDVGEFIRLVRGVGSYDAFQDLLATVRAEATSAPANGA